MSLAVDPPTCSVPAGGGTLIHQLANPGAERIVFKIKCSNNAEYRIKPVIGFVEPGSVTPFTVTRKPGAPKEDKMVIHFGPAPADSADPTGAFAAIGASPAGLINIPMYAA